VLRKFKELKLNYLLSYNPWLTGTNREMFMADVMDAALANHRVFMQWCAHDAEVALTQYRKANGIPSPSNSDTYSP
jgi:hypothetical protein